MTAYAHALPPLDSRRGPGEPGPRCGALAGSRIALFAEDVTCPDCLGQMETEARRAAIRTGIERAERAVGTVVLDLSVWEGRGDWSALPDEQRREAGARGLAHLDAAIVALGERRAELHAALGDIEDQDDAADNDGPHDHHFEVPRDPATGERLQPGFADCSCGMTHERFVAGSGAAPAAGVAREPTAARG